MVNHWTAKLVPAVGPLVVLCGLAALDHGSNGPAPFADVLVGMALLGGLAALAWWGTQRLAPLPRALQAALSSAAEGMLGVVLVFLLVAPLTVLLPQPWVVALFRDDRATDLLTMLILGVGLVVAGRAMVAAKRQATRTAEAERDAATTRAELAERERELVRAELQVLRAQVEPHFLWNTLANVEYLIRKDPPQAAAMMAHLVAYLRSSVTGGRSTLSTLGSEFASVRAYLGLMQFRMGERLTFELTLAPDAAEQAFPPMVLQTLVENAIKHGLEPLPGAARLVVCAGLAPGNPERLIVDVVDNGVGLQAHPRTRGTGLGLRQVRDRLQALHGRLATLAITGNEGGGVCARIDMSVQAPPTHSLTAP
jgi:signal transduction histidine kinase